MDGILYEDVDILVCRKKAGVPVQSARLGQKDMVSQLNNYLAEKRESVKGGKEEIYVVHRLDQPVEGVIVFGKTKRAAAELSRQINGGSMKKVYRAVCCMEKELEAYGEEAPEQGKERILVDYLLKDGKTNTSRVVKKESRDAKRAELSYRVADTLCLKNPGGKASKRREEENRRSGGSEKNGVEVCKNKNELGYVLAEIDLKTGRHHQIRVQMANAGMPLYGDQKYNKNWKEFRMEDDGMPSLALCAVSLTFRHPVTKKKMEFYTEPENPAFALFEKCEE